MTKVACIICLTSVLFFAFSCSKLKEKGTEPQPTDQYAGSGSCVACHAGIYNQFIQTGHPHILNKIENGPPSHPSGSGVPDPPAAYSWSDISYVIGGFGWKANFIDQNGNLITGDETQYNLADESFSAFALPGGGADYGLNCASCHTTGYSSSGHQDNLPGISGSWAESGVTCESCHGGGYQHVRAPQDSVMTVDGSAEACGQCHNRTSDNKIAASGSSGEELILQYQQYDEVGSTLHASLACVSCHNPHLSAKYDADNAISQKCGDCHTNIVVNHPPAANCVACHMPRSAISGTSAGGGIHRHGDLRSHIVKVNTDTTQAQFYTSTGQLYSRGYNNLNFTCLSSCHQGSDLEFAAANAPLIHSAGN